ncbi:hypothetical protein Tco_1334703 [Tanacetum coccineum]
MVLGQLPTLSTKGLIIEEPFVVLDRRMAKKGNVAADYVLIQWVNGTPADVTWELYKDIAARFPIKEESQKLKKYRLGLKRLHGFLEVTAAQDLEKIHEDNLEAMNTEVATFPLAKWEAHDCNKLIFSDFKQFDGGYVAFRGDAYGGKILGKGTLKTANLDFEDVYFVND